MNSREEALSPPCMARCAFPWLAPPPAAAGRMRCPKTSYGCLVSACLLRERRARHGLSLLAVEVTISPPPPPPHSHPFLSIILSTHPSSATAEEHAREADLAICLGTSLQITPACNLPLKATKTFKHCAKQQPGQLAIINLQRTQHDAKAVKSGGLVCHARCDEVMRRLASRLRLAIPSYERRDAVAVGSVQHVAVGTSLPFSVHIQSSHGAKCPMPMVVAVDVSFEVGLPSAVVIPLHACTCCLLTNLYPIPLLPPTHLLHVPCPCSPPPCYQDPHLRPASLSSPPFVVRRTALQPGPVRVRLTLHLHEAADVDKRRVELHHTVDLQQREAAASRSSGPQQQRYEFVTQYVRYDDDDAGGADDPVAAAVVAAIEAPQEKSGEEAATAKAAGGGPGSGMQRLPAHVKRQRMV